MRLKTRPIDWSNRIIYIMLFMLFVIFFILPTVESLREAFERSNLLITIKILASFACVFAFLSKYIKGYKEFIRNLNINSNNVSYIKWTLRRKNIYAIFKTTLVITPFLMFVIIQSGNLNNSILSVNQFIPSIGEAVVGVTGGDNSSTTGSIGDAVANRGTSEVIDSIVGTLDGTGAGGVVDIIESTASNSGFSDRFLINLFQNILNYNQWISIIISLFISTSIFSMFLVLSFYIIWKISMNKYYRQIKNQFNKISNNINTDIEITEKEKFEEVVKETYNKEISLENERMLYLYTFLAQKDADFWKEVKKSTTPPHFNLGIK